MKTKMIIEVVLLLLLIAGLIGYAEYKKNSNKKLDLTKEDMSKRLIELELTKQDVSNLDGEFLKKWLESAEYFLTHGGGGGLPGWEYGKKFNYKGKDYFIKGGTTNDPNKGI